MRLSLLNSFRQSIGRLLMRKAPWSSDAAEMVREVKLVASALSVFGQSNRSKSQSLVHLRDSIVIRCTMWTFNLLALLPSLPFPWRDFPIYA